MIVLLQKIYVLFRSVDYYFSAGQAQNVVFYSDHAPGQSQTLVFYGEHAPGRAQNVVFYGERDPGRAQNVKFATPFTCSKEAHEQNHVFYRCCPRKSRQKAVM